MFQPASRCGKRAWWRWQYIKENKVKAMYRRLLLLNGLAILAVVLYHASGWGFVAMFWWTDRYLSVSVPNFDQLGSPTYYALRVIEQLIAFAVPAFLFVSGFFAAFANRRQRSAGAATKSALTEAGVDKRRTIGWTLVWARIKALGIPFLMWSVVFLTLDAMQGEIRSATEYVVRLVTGGAADQLYYVPLLCQLYLLSPFLIALGRRRPWLLLALAAVAQLGMHALQYAEMLLPGMPFFEAAMDYAPQWLFTWRVFWFALGIVFGLDLAQAKQALARLRPGLPVAVFVTAALGVLEWEALFNACGMRCLAPRETAVDGLYALSVILAVLAFEDVTLPFSRGIGGLGARSFGIYLLHGHVLEFVSRVIYHVAPWMLAYQALQQPLLVVAGVGLPLLLMLAVDRSPARAAYEYLFG